MDDRIRFRSNAVFGARLVFADPNENSVKPGLDCRAHVKLGIIADHHRVRGREAHMRHGQAEEIRRGFAEVPAECWRERVKIWLTAAKAALDAWPASWGPAPGTEGCLMPADCLAGVPA